MRRTKIITTFGPSISDPKILKRIMVLRGKSEISPNAFSFLSSLAAGFKKYGGVTQKQYEAFWN